MRGPLDGGSVMRILCTGSRNWDRPDVVDGALDIIAQAAVDAGEHELVVVHGACFPKPDKVTGQVPRVSADWLVELWARRWQLHPLTVRIERHPADWRRYGRRYAGRKRNQDMVYLGADLVLAFHRAGSPGTAHCVEAAEKAELTTRVIDYDDIPDAAEVSS